MTSKLDGRLPFASFGDARFQPVAGVEICNPRRANGFHVNKDVCRQIVQPVDEAVALYAIEPFNLHRLKLAGRILKRLTVGTLSWIGYRTHGARQCLAKVDRKNLYGLQTALLFLHQSFHDRAFRQAAPVMLAKDREMDQDITFAVGADEEAETARRVEPFYPSSDRYRVRRDRLLLGLTQDRMPNSSAPASSGTGLGRLVGTRTHADTLARLYGFQKMNR